MAIHFMALAQATDCLKIAEKLCPTSQRIYNEIRKITPTITDDTPFYEDIVSVEKYLRNNPLKLK